MVRAIAHILDVGSANDFPAGEAERRAYFETRVRGVGILRYRASLLKESFERGIKVGHQCEAHSWGEVRG